MFRLIVIGAILCTALSSCTSAPTPTPAPTPDLAALVSSAASTAVARLPTQTPYPTYTPNPTAPASPTDIAVVAGPTDTAVPTATASPTSAPTGTPTAVPTASPSVSAASSVNLRSGPGTEYPIVGALAQGQRYDVQGRTEDSAWWEVAAAGQQLAWVAAAVVTTTGDMASAPVERNIPTPPPTATPAPAAAATPITQTATSASGTVTSTQACYVFHNFIGSTVHGTFTRQGDEKRIEFDMASHTDQTVCFDPGRWTYTISAPQWNDITDGFQAVAGQQAEWPINGICNTSPVFQWNVDSGTSVQVGTVKTCGIQEPPR